MAAPIPVQEGEGEVGMMGGGRQQTQRVTWPQPLPQPIPKNQPCQSPCPHPVSGPKSPGPRGPESKFWPLLRPQILLLATTISPGGMQVTPPPTPTRPGIYPPKSKNLGFPPPLFARRERGRGHEIEGFPPQSQSQWSRLLWKQTPPRQTKTRRATGTKTRCPERQAQSGRSRERQRLAGQRARRSGRNRDGSCGQVLSHTATGNHRNSGTPRSGQTGRHPARGAEITEAGRKR